MNRLLKTILPDIADKIHHWWSFGIAAIAVFIIICLACCEAWGLKNKRERDDDELGY